jgi:hypothetical protein
MAAARPRPRPRGKLRDVRWNVQWWAALTSVLAGLMSIPALVISMNALALSEQQRRDALAQRAEDQRERTRAKAEADELARTAFLRGVHIWPVWDFQKPNVLRWNVRNSNARPVLLYLRWDPGQLASKENPVRYYEIEAEPRSQSVMSPELPRSEGAEHEFAVAADHEAREVWVLGPDSKPIDAEKWLNQGTYTDGTFEPIDPERIQRDIVPCT